MGGPNLLRSQLSLSDRDGENIIPFIQGSVPGVSMPAIPMSLENAKAVAKAVEQGRIAPGGGPVGGMAGPGVPDIKINPRPPG